MNHRLQNNVSLWKKINIDIFFIERYKKIMANLSNDFYKTNEAYVLAQTNGKMFGLHNNRPEAMIYLLQTIQDSLETKSDIKIDVPHLRQIWVEFGIIDPMTFELRYKHAEFLNRAFQLEDSLKKSIYDYHMPPEQSQNSSEGCCDAVSTSVPIGFQPPSRNL
jgi:hypothetical protein